MKQFNKKMVILFLFTLTGFFSSSAAVVSIFNLPVNDTVYNAVEEQPQFQGGIKKAFDFIEKNLQYPDSSFKNNIEGKVVVKFIVRSNGKTDSLSILKGVNDEIDNEAMRLLRNFPDWIPGSISGKYVSSYYVFPVSFKINKQVIKTDSKIDTTHVLVPVTSIPVFIDDMEMPADFDVISINFNCIDTGKFVEPYPLSKQSELVSLYGDKAKNGILSLKPKRFDVIRFESVNNESGLYKGKSVALADDNLLVFPGGKAEFVRLLSNKMKYPENAKSLNLQEDNIVRFIVDTLGGIHDFSFQTKGFYSIENKLVETLKEIKSWKPLIKSGIKTEVLVSVPFSFHLNKIKTEKINFFNAIDSTGFSKPTAYINQIKLPENFDLSLLDLTKLEKSSDFNPINKLKFNLSKDRNMIKTVLYYNNNDSISGYPVYSDIDTMPEFPGGKLELYKYLGNNVKYPIQSMMNKESDEILVTYVVMPTGEIQDIVAVKGKYPILNDEVKKLVKRMPRWKPGIKNGNPVAVRCKLPVKFK